MNLLLILLPFVVFASSELEQPLGDEIGTKLSADLAYALNLSFYGASLERPADYLADYFIYRHCDLTLNKKQMYSLMSELVFNVISGYRDHGDSLVIDASNPISGNLMRIRAEQNKNLLGGYLIQQVTVACKGRGFA